MGGVRVCVCVRFLFTDYNRLSSVGGETSMAEMVATLSDACEREFGFMATRLFRVFKNDENQGTVILSSHSVHVKPILPPSPTPLNLYPASFECIHLSPSLPRSLPPLLSSGKKWKKTCCVPSFVLFVVTLGCLITGMALLAIFKVRPFDTLCHIQHLNTSSLCIF